MPRTDKSSTGRARSTNPKVRKHKKKNPIEEARQRFSVAVKTKNGIRYQTDVEKFNKWLINYLVKSKTLSGTKGFHVGQLI